MTHLVRLLHEHHAKESAIMARIQAGTLTPEMWDSDPDAREHDRYERDILFVMAPMSEEEILAALDQYEHEGGYL